MKTLFLIATGIAALTLPSSSVLAKTSEQRILEPFEACRDIVDNNKRLSCFDNAVSTGQSRALAEQNNRVKRRKEDFGLTSKQIKKSSEAQEASAPSKSAKRIARDEVIKQVDSKVTDVFTNGYSKQMFVLENGQMWQETDIRSYNGSVRPGKDVTIKKGRFAGYRLKVGKQVGFIGVRRVK